MLYEKLTYRAFHVLGDHAFFLWSAPGMSNRMIGLGAVTAALAPQGRMKEKVRVQSEALETLFLWSYTSRTRS